MTNVASLADQLTVVLSAAIVQSLSLDDAFVDPVLRSSEHAHFQANAGMSLAKSVGKPPREIATAIAESVALASSALIREITVSGPGFLNIDVTDAALIGQLNARIAAGPRLGIEQTPEAERQVIDYSQPNIAKEMHVGHLRSTVIGDSLYRVLDFLGFETIRQNHIGDWGTAFGMLIEYMFQNPGFLSDAVDGDAAMSNLDRLYKTARAKFNEDPEFADLARLRVVALQSGDPQTLDAWHQIVGESLRYFTFVYDMLDVKLTNDDIVGESFYNPWLAEIADDLLARGVATMSDGAVCVFFDDVKGHDGQPTPLIVRKQDGGFGYAATDLAAIRHRVNTLGAKRIIYVVDTRQSLHFKMVFETARRAGYLPDDVEVVHVNFGTILGSDNKPLKSRAGDVLRLSELLKESVERANLTLTERSPELDSDTREARAREIGIGAVKYADLSTNRIKDYVLDFDRMLALQGNTSVYLQYANARINSVMSKADSLARHDAPADVTTILVDEERSLLLLLDKFGSTIQQVADTLEPHHLTTYLFDLSQAFTAFYEACPVLKADTEEQLVLRLAICDLCRATLARGLDLLGIRAPDRL